MSEFVITRNGRRIHGILLGETVSQSAEIAELFELQEYGFEIDDRDPDTEYAIWIGDIEAATIAASESDELKIGGGIARGLRLLWDDRCYFEGSRGLVWVRVSSRDRDGDRRWHDRALVPVFVVLTKLSEEQYHVMFEQLRGLAEGLVHDLFSKSWRGVHLSKRKGQVGIRSSHTELQVLEKIWPPIAQSLELILREPANRLTSNRRLRSCWGGERFGTRALAQLASCGVDPRSRKFEAPFSAAIECVTESADTYEHRAIRGFLEFLLHRLEEFCRKIDSDIDVFNRQRRWRDRSSGEGQSLFELEDIPRIQRLKERRTRAESLREEIRHACGKSVLRRVVPSFRLADTPVFRNVGSYQRIYREIVRYLSTGLIIVDEGTEERIKSTSRMYEQWVFLQLASALKAAGLVCNSQDGVLHRARHARFIVDVERGATVTYSLSANSTIRVRYEPWIMPYNQARQTLDPLFFGRGDSALSPDVVLELVRGREAVGAPALVIYGLVIDAKYSRNIHERHWHDTGKYLRIQSTSTLKQVIRQLWLVHPGSGAPEITFRDNAYEWTDGGPNSAAEDVVEAVLQLAPCSDMHLDDVEPGWIGRPNPNAVQFIAGLLRFFEVAGLIE